MVVKPLQGLVDEVEKRLKAPDFDKRELKIRN